MSVSAKRIIFTVDVKQKIIIVIYLSWKHRKIFVIIRFLHQIQDYTIQDMTYGGCTKVIKGALIFFQNQ